MFDINPTGRALTWLGSTALAAVEALQSTEGLYVEPRAVQVMIFHERIGQLGGISTDRRGQYILASAVAGRITIKQLHGLGFHHKVETSGHRYWYRRGHNDFRNLFAALGEITGLVI